MAFDHLKFPMTKYHPVLGKRTADKQDDLDKVFVGPEHNWWDTPEEADMHRTAADAEMVRHNSVRMRIDNVVSEGDPDGEKPDLAEQVDIGTVVNSVQHHEYVVKPILEAPTEEERQAQADRVEAAAQKSRDSMEADARAGSPVHTEASPG
jgi:hypothetical protein